MNGSLIQKRVEQAITNRVFPGCVIGITDKAGVRKISSFGNFTYETDASPVLENTVYDIASMTKVVPVALTALMFIEKGILNLEDKITQFIPEIDIENAEKGLIKHLLTYTYALKKNSDPNFSYENSKAKDIFEFLYKRDFEFTPGTRYQYGNAPAILLGIILERISGEKLYDLTRRMILEPLGMDNSTFCPSYKEIIPPTETVSWRGEIQGIVHDETSFILQEEGFNSGCAGLFSNVTDLLNVMEMILNEGLYKGNKIFDKRTITLMTTNALDEIKQLHSIGWELNQPKFMGSFSNENMIGRTGFTGTCCIIDPTRGKGLAILSNRTYPKRPQNAEAINTFRRDIADIVFSP